MSESLRRQEEALEAARNASRIESLGIGRFSGSSTPLSESLAARQFHQLTPARMERRAEMNQPYQPYIAEPVQSGITSGLLLSQLNREAIEKQARFFALLESKYGAIKGNDNSYEQAINRYHDDEEAMLLANQQMMELQSQRSERFKKMDERLKTERESLRPMQQLHSTLFQHNYQDRLGSQRREQEAEESRRQQSQWEEMHSNQREWEQYQRQQHQQQQQQQRSYARGGPAQEPPRPGKRPKMPINKALTFMGIDPRSTPTARDLKMAFNRRALALHPDKNLHDQVKAANKFKRMRKAFNVAMKNGQSDSDTTGSVGGATLRRRQKRYRRSKNTYRKTHKSTTKRR